MDEFWIYIGNCLIIIVCMSLKFLGLKISNLTVMLLNTMIQDCLVHVKSDALNLDITITEGW